MIRWSARFAVAAMLWAAAAAAQSGATIRSQGVDVFYDSYGSGAPVILLHGLGLSRLMWDEQLPLARDYRLIRIDFPGAGRSGAMSGPVSFANVVADVMTAAGVDRAHIVGLSNGGQIAIDLALSRPELVRSLVLADAAIAGFRFSTEMLSRIQRYQALAAGDGVEAANEAWLTDPLFAPAQRDATLGRRLREIVMPYTGEYWTNASWRRGLSPAAITRLQEIRAPTLVLVGELDLADFQAQADTLGKAIPGARRVVLRGVGHMSNMEAPQEFNMLLLSFLRER